MEKITKINNKNFENLVIVNSYELCNNSIILWL